MVWPPRPITRPTSPCRSCNLKTVVLPLGISVSTISSGNSINCRMTNSRNSLMRQKTNHEWTRIDTNFFRLILEVGRFEIFRVFANRPLFLAVGPQQPEPIVAAVADEIAMLRDQKA